jgi:hypothetical protein
MGSAPPKGEQASGFDRLLNSTTCRKIDARSVDRLGRSLQHLVGFLEELDAAGCDLYSSGRPSMRGGQPGARFSRCSRCSQSSNERSSRIGANTLTEYHMAVSFFSLNRFRCRRLRWSGVKKLDQRDSTPLRERSAQCPIPSHFDPEPTRESPAGMTAATAGGRPTTGGRSSSITNAMPDRYARNCAASARAMPRSSTSKRSRTPSSIGRRLISPRPLMRRARPSFVAGLFHFPQALAGAVGGIISAEGRHPVADQGRWRWASSLTGSGSTLSRPGGSWTRSSHARAAAKTEIGARGRERRGRGVAGIRERGAPSQDQILYVNLGVISSPMHQRILPLRQRARGRAQLGEQVDGTRVPRNAGFPPMILPFNRSLVGARVERISSARAPEMCPFSKTIKNNQRKSNGAGNLSRVRESNGSGAPWAAATASSAGCSRTASSDRARNWRSA